MIPHPYHIWDKNDERPAVPYEIEDAPGSGTPLNLSGATFELEIVADPEATAIYTKTTGIVGSATFPNAVAGWNAGELAGIAGLPSGLSYWFLKLSWTVGGLRETLDPEFWPFVGIRN